MEQEGEGRKEEEDSDSDVQRRREDESINVETLFATYNRVYFQRKLDSVRLLWSYTMTVQSGEFVHRGRRDCKIYLSEPILKFRSRADLIDTLLHEMIHAYLFLTYAKDPLGHGEAFLKMARDINAREGSNVKQYHNFKNEVQFYQSRTSSSVAPKPVPVGSVNNKKRPHSTIDTYFTARSSATTSITTSTTTTTTTPNHTATPEKTNTATATTQTTKRARISTEKDEEKNGGIDLSDAFFRADSFFAFADAAAPRHSGSKKKDKDHVIIN